MRFCESQNEMAAAGTSTKGDRFVNPVEIIIPAPSSATTETKATPESRVERWAASLFSAPIRTDVLCTWRCHVRHSAARVLGFLVYLSARDPERFCWPGWRSISGNASKIGEKQIGRAQVFAILALLERNLILERAVELRRGAKRHGFVVRPHDAWTIAVPELDVCGLRANSDQLLRWAAGCVENRRRRQSLVARMGAKE